MERGSEEEGEWAIGMDAKHDLKINATAKKVDSPRPSNAILIYSKRTDPEDNQVGVLLAAPTR